MCFLRCFLNDDLAIENSMSLVVEYAAVVLRADGFRRGMDDAYPVIHVLFAGGKKQAVQMCFCSLSCENNVNFISQQLAAKLHAVMRKSRRFGDPYF